MKLKLLHIAAALSCLLLFDSVAQAQADKRKQGKKGQFFNNIFNRVKSSVTVTPRDSTIKATVINVKSEVPFTEYQGKIIRKIDTKELGFEKVFTDTLKRINYYGTRLINVLHTNTYGWVIKDNLFIREGTRLNPYLLADNERYLRSLEFIQDARIIVIPVRGSADSVDISVITKDLFSITGSLDFSGANRQKIRVAETNLAGAGQKIQVIALRDANRHPEYGYDLLYAKNSLLHSFINGTVGYSLINSDRTGQSNVESFYLNLSKPLFSPFSRSAGGFDLRFNKSQNLFQVPDSLFYNYRNASIDAWAGYNIGVNRLLQNNTNRNRTFVAVRYLKNNFLEAPFQVGKSFNSLFNNTRALLGEVTFFRQEFYKTNYIFGFGTTEDVPYGYNVAFTGGWYQQLNLARSYFGINTNRYIASSKGKFNQFYLRAGAFLHNGRFEDASVLAGGSTYSKLYIFPNFKMRQYIKYSYTRLFNRVTYDPLRINNTLGLRNFRADSLFGSQRVSVYAETFFFARYKLLGFQLAPFLFSDASLLTGLNNNFSKSDIFTGIGGGVRTRNVNLVFATAELRLIYFPRKAQNMNAFQITFNSNIRFRYNTNYVRSPDVIQLNTDDVNSFY